MDLQDLDNISPMTPWPHTVILAPGFVQFLNFSRIAPSSSDHNLYFFCNLYFFGEPLMHFPIGHFCLVVSCQMLRIFSKLETTNNGKVSQQKEHHLLKSGKCFSCFQTRKDFQQNFYIFWSSILAGSNICLILCRKVGNQSVFWEQVLCWLTAGPSDDPPHKASHLLQTCDIVNYLRRQSVPVTWINLFNIQTIHTWC